VTAKQKPVHKKITCAVFGVLLLASGSSAEAQQAKKVPLIGYYSGEGGPSTSTPNIEAFRQGLRDLGYIEGK